MTKLLITRPLAEPVMEEAHQRFDVTLHEEGALSAAEAAEALQCYDAILPTLGDQFTAGAFEAAGPACRAKMIGNFGVGWNHIDGAAAARAGVMVSNTPDVLTDATADIGMTLLLAVARRAGEGERMLRAGRWGGFGPKNLLGTQVTGKHIGIVGMGRIGQAVARRAHFGFGMTVSFFNRSPKSLEFPATQISDLCGLAGAVDFLVVTVPGGAETEKLISADVLAAMRPEAFLINIARGEVVDEAALIGALERGAIAGAGLDVYENEPHVPAALRALENAVLLPHLGSATVETRQAMAQMALDNIKAWSEGQEPPQRVA